MAGNAVFFGVPEDRQNTMAGENAAQNVLSRPGFTFTGSLSPLAPQFQPPQAQDSFSAPYRPSWLTLPDTYNPRSYGFTHHINYMQYTPNMPPHQLQEQPTNSMSRTSAPYSAMYPSGSAFGAAQARGMPGQMANQQQQQQQTPSFHRNMPGGTSPALTTHQRPMAQAYSPSARAQQLQSPFRTPSANAVRGSSQHTPRMPASPYSAPTFEQQLAAMARASSNNKNIFTPHPSIGLAQPSPVIQNQPIMGRPNARRPAPGVQTTQAATPAQPIQNNMTNANMQGQKRPACDSPQEVARAFKIRRGTDPHGNQVVTYIHPGTGQAGQMSAETFQKWWQQMEAQKKQANEARKAEQIKNEHARLKALADEEEKKKAAAAKAKAEQAERARLAAIAREKEEQQKRIAAAAAKAAKEKAEQERQARIKEQQRLDRLEAEKQKRLAAEQKAWADEQARQAWIAQEARRERERKLLRKEQLRKDPSSLYRYYREYLTFFPVDGKGGERTNSYLFKLLANRQMPDDETEELALAITYAKNHWQFYMEYPRDVKDAAEAQREEMERRKEDQRPVTSAAAFAKVK